MIIKAFESATPNPLPIKKAFIQGEEEPHLIFPGLKRNILCRSSLYFARPLRLPVFFPGQIRGIPSDGRWGSVSAAARGGAAVFTWLRRQVGCARPAREAKCVVFSSSWAILFTAHFVAPILFFLHSLPPFFHSLKLLVISAAKVVESARAAVPLSTNFFRVTASPSLPAQSLSAATVGPHAPGAQLLRQRRLVLLPYGAQ